MQPQDKVYIPFWIIQEHLDSAPPDPFILCKVLKIYNTRVVDGSQYVTICDLEIKKDLIAESIPIAYLIHQKDIEEWARKISDWFLEFPKRI